MRYRTNRDGISLDISRVMRLGVIVLIMAISLSPRIPLGIAIPGRGFDLRFEDMILVALLLLWFFLRPRIYLTPLFKAIGIYFSVVIITSSVAVMTLDLVPIKTFFYSLKELEYFLIFFFVANWIRTEADCRLASGFLLFAGLLNAIWVGFQLATFQRSSFFLVERELSVDVYSEPRLLESYGPHLIGEASPLSTGGFFMLVFILTLSFYLFSRAGNRRWLYAVLGIMFLTSLALSFSRVAMVGAVIGTVILLSQDKLKIIIKTIPILIIMLAVGALMMDQLGYLGDEGRLSYAGINNSVVVRLQEIWLPLLHQQNVSSLFLGFGKGALGTLKGLEATEAHNYYLRVFLESGLFGLLAFVGLLGSVIFLSARVFSGGKLAISKVVGGATLAATVALSIAALFQDVFTPVVLNELWWILVGLTVAAHRIESTSKNLPSNVS